MKAELSSAFKNVLLLEPFKERTRPTHQKVQQKCERLGCLLSLLGCTWNRTDLMPCLLLLLLVVSSSRAKRRGIPSVPVKCCYVC